MRPLLQQLSPFSKHKNNIRILHRSKTMRHNYHSAALPRTLKGLLHQLF